MTDELTFVDTKILLYADDRSAAAKHDQAAELLARLWGARSGVLSTQVLQVSYVTATCKLPRPLPAARARAVISRYATWRLHRIEAAESSPHQSLRSAIGWPSGMP